MRPSAPARCATAAAPQEAALAFARTPEGQQAAADAAALEAAGIDLEGRRACTLARTAAALKQWWLENSYFLQFAL